MPFNLKPQDGDGFTPYVKYNAKAGRWYYRNDGSAEELELHNPQFVVDMANIQTGWIFYAAGSAPVRVADPAPGVMADRPPGTNTFKRGFWVKVWNQQTGVREFSSCASSVISPICEMYSLFEAQGPQHPGEAMVVACVKVVPVKGKKDTNYAPVFALQGWSHRGMFGAHNAPNSAHNAPNSAHNAPNDQRSAQTGGFVNTHGAAPPVQQRPQPVAANDPATRAWQTFLGHPASGEPTGKGERWKKAFEAYFQRPYSPATISEAEWNCFARDGFVAAAPELLPPAGTAMAEEEIPF